METCRKCGEQIERRVSKRLGRVYYVNTVGSIGPVGQMHSRWCQGRRAYSTIPPVPETIPSALPATEEPNAFGTVHLEAAKSNGTDIAALIAAAVAPYMRAPEATIDENRVRSIVKETMGENGALHVVVSVRESGKQVIDAGRQHKQFPMLLTIIGRRRNVWLAGPAGSGKTSAAHAAATALGIPFGAISVGPQTTQSALFGYMDAHGNYVATEFRRRYENGGVFLFDEIDRGNPGVLTALNQAIENGTCAFPDAMVAKHPDFVAIAAANTYGTGASREYVGALQLDAATLDRFIMVPWDYDESLEYDLASATYAAAGGTDRQAFESWVSKVRLARSKATTHKVRHVISPRASIIGADLLASGIDAETVAQIALWKGLDAQSVGMLS